MKGKEIVATGLGISLIVGGLIVLTKYSNRDFKRVMNEAEIALSKFRVLTGLGSE